MPNEELALPQYVPTKPAPTNLGHYFILVGPSGAGKNTLLRRVLEELDDLEQMATATTRPRRADETDGLHHFFLTSDEFDQRVGTGGFIEWQIVHGHRYGTLKSVVLDGIAKGKDRLADVEVLGATSLKRLLPQHVTLIFVQPSSLDALERRIRQRGSESEDEIKPRLDRAQFELSFLTKCDYVLWNDDLDVALRQLSGIILAKRSERSLSALREARGEPSHAFHYAASAILIDQASRRVLLVERRDFRGNLRLLPPGGHVERGEYPHEAVIREVLEETGFHVRHVAQPAWGDADSNAMPAPPPIAVLIENDGYHFHHDSVYAFLLSDDGRSRSGDVSWRWVPIDRLDDPAIPLDVRDLVARTIAELSPPIS